MKSLSCLNRYCPPSGRRDAGAIIRHGFYTSSWGKRPRYLCQACGKTFCSTTGTPCRRLQHRRAIFDEVASLSVEGLNKSAIARIERVAWNTVHRWLERAAAWCRRFNDRRIRRLFLAELQADEIETIVGGKEQTIWVFVVIDVWSRLWSSTIVGKRSFRNTLALFRNLSKRMNPEVIPLITTDGFEFYKKVIGRVFGPACLYGHRDAPKRSHREGRTKDDDWVWGGLQQTLRGSEDSSKLNTSFIERLNLAIRQGSAYLGRRTIDQARWKQYRDDHLKLLRCHYNFVRPRRSSKFGREVRTPALQAGLTTRPLTLREIFSSRMILRLSKNVILLLFASARPVTFTPPGLALVA